MRIDQQRLKDQVTRIFEACGSQASEAERISHYLVEANLAGHDSHGVIRVADYVRYVREDKVRINQTIQVVLQTGGLVVVDGQYGFGQVVGEQAMRLGIKMATEHGIAGVALRNSGHLGRIGDWPMLLAQSGLVSVHFVNTSGFGLLVAPFGGIDRRLSANPIAAGVPVAGSSPLILDISTSAIAEGKLKVARNRGEKVSPGCILDANGRPTDDPFEFYTDPPGALLPFGGHKGYGLGVIAEMMAGALTGNGCSSPSRADRLLNGMFSIIVDPARLPRDFDFADEVARFIAFVKSSRRLTADGEILMPGELEERTRATRLSDGIQLDATTWRSLQDVCHSLGVKL